MSIPFWQRPWLDGAKEHYEDDWTQADVEDIDFPERDPEYEAWLDDFDRRVDDLYSEQNGDIGDEPF